MLRVLSSAFYHKEVAGFNQVTELPNGGIIIIGNDQLETLKGFEKLERVAGYVTIKRNPKLSRCEAEAFANRIDEVGGEVVIEDNGPCE